MRFIASLLTVVALALGGTSLAVAAEGHPAEPAAKHAKFVKKHHARHSIAARKADETPGEESSNGRDTDAAAQAAACAKDGVDPNGSNVNFDDATGTCDDNG